MTPPPNLTPATGWITVAGLGPGDEALVTPQVREALAQATDVIGYFPYVARVAPREGLTLHGSDNRVELDRARHALDLAAKGRRVVIVSSGDPGVFAMASALFEAVEAELAAGGSGEGGAEDGAAATLARDGAKSGAKYGGAKAAFAQGGAGGRAEADVANGGAEADVAEGGTEGGAGAAVAQDGGAKAAAASGIATGGTASAPTPDRLDIRILPGITAMLAAAARAGAPLGHDFCAINLSDNLKPWPLVERRLRLAAQADFAMAFYNPRSASRPHQFARALEVLREECGPDRLVIFARAVTTPDERLTTVTLAEATREMADMRTVVLVGNAATRRVGRWVYTPRRAE